LLDRGYDVRILDRFDYGRLGIDGLQHPRLEIVQGDICNSRAVSQAVKDVDGVLALAAIVGDPACNLDPEETIDLNYAATKILIEACNFYGVRRLVFASSCSVYGANSDGMLTERSRLDPVSLYARTRVLSENILFDRRGDVEPVVTRARHREALERALAEVEAFQTARQGGVDAAAAATHLRAALGALDDLIGVVTPDDVLDRVFASFCVGK